VQWLQNLRRLEIQINRIASKGLFRESKGGRYTLLVCLQGCLAALEHLEVFQLEFCKDLSETKWDFVAGLDGVLRAAGYELLEFSPTEKGALTVWTVIFKKGIAKQDKQDVAENMGGEESYTMEAR
jgi:hypothetical protein